MVHSRSCEGLYSHSGDVFTRESIGGVTNQQTSLTHSPEGEGEQRIHGHTFRIQIHTYTCMYKNNL